MKKLFLFVALTSLLQGCVSLESVSLTQIPEERTNLVTADAHDYVFLGIVTQNDFANEAVEALKKKCPGGKLTGILTKQQSTSYFLVSKREVIASGYCQHPGV